MTLPALPDDEDAHLRLRALPDYEPAEPTEATEPAEPDRSTGLRRWSSLRPVSGPQLRLAPPPQPPGEPQVPPAALVRVLRHVFEVLDGRRPVAQLRSLLPDDAFEGVLTRLRTTGPGGHHTLRSIHPCAPTPNALEVAVVVDHRSPRGHRRVLAAAARFERVVPDADDRAVPHLPRGAGGRGRGLGGDQWLCTVLRLL
jgi:hypothetical protein